MFLHDLKAPKGSNQRRKIVGRGRGSGHGKTSTRGHKGQRSRAGRGIILGLEGGQVPLIRRLPKFGFRNRNPLDMQVINVETLNKFSNGTVITAEFLKSKGLIRSLNRPFKILGTGDLKKSLTIQGGRVSKAAQEKIAKAGGKVESVESSSLTKKESIAKK